MSSFLYRLAQRLLPLELILATASRLSILTKRLANRRRAYLHSINTLRLFHDLPQLILLTARQNDSRAAIRSIPAMLAIFMLHRNALATTETPAIGANFLINKDLLQTDKVAHVGVSAALLRLLRRLLHKADFVRVLAGIAADTLALQGAEDVVDAPVFAQVFLVAGAVFLRLFEVLARGVDTFLGFLHGFAFARVGAGGFGEDAVLDEHYAQIAEFGVEPGADGRWEIVFEFVDWWLVSIIPM